MATALAAVLDDSARFAAGIRYPAPGGVGNAYFDESARSPLVDGQFAFDADEKYRPSPDTPEIAKRRERALVD